MSITATEFKNNFGKYMELAKTQDIIVSKNGKVALIVTSPEKKKLDNMRSLFGVLPQDFDQEKIDEERIKNL